MRSADHIDYLGDEPECERTLDCNVCGCEVPATLEWCDPDYEPRAETTCESCGEPLCDDCECCADEDEENTDPVMVTGAADNEGKATT